MIANSDGGLLSRRQQTIKSWSKSSARQTVALESKLAIEQDCRQDNTTVKKITGTGESGKNMKKCSHRRGEICIYCTITGGENNECSLFKKELSDLIPINKSENKGR